MRGRKVDLAGRVFGNLTVTRHYRKRNKPNKNLVWLCKCTCGAEVWKSQSNLVAGRIRSCGRDHRIDSPNGGSFA